MNISTTIVHKKCIFINPPNIEESFLDASVVPIGILYLQAFLKKNNIYTEIINLYGITNWHEVEDMLHKVVQPDCIVCIPCYTRQRKSVLKLCNVIKIIHPSIHIILGGPHATFLDKALLKHNKGIGFIVRGEGEFTLFSLIMFLNSGSVQIADIKGLTYRHNGSIVRNDDRPQITNFKDFPSPRLSANYIKDIQAVYSINKNFDPTSIIAPILASRGCQNNCIFCCDGSLFSKQIYRPIDQVISDIKYLNKTLGVNSFDFYDSNLGGDPEYLYDLCYNILKADINVKWWCSTRADTLSEDMVRIMKRAGCFMISLGVESGSNEILDRINKNISLSHLRSVSTIIKSHDVLLRTTLTIGNIGESIRTIKQTSSLINSIRPHKIGLFFMKIYPGTPLYKYCIDKKFISDEIWFDPIKGDTQLYTFENSTHELFTLFQIFINNLWKNFRITQQENYNFEISTI